MFNAGTYKQQYEYKSFSPFPINQNYQWQDPEINLMIEKGMHYLGELNAYSTLVPDVDFFIRMHITKEATSSNRIEGTRTNIDEAILPETEIHPEKQNDWEEIQNYIKATNFSIKELEKLPLSIRLLKDTHRHLLSGVRGKHKQPGEIRKSQNWIGGSSLKDALYIPPHTDELPDLLTNLEKFWHNRQNQIPQLIQIAITHYQFETIHPFLDGNGRIGRLLIVLQLVEKEILKKPCLYLSDFFERHKGSYYDALTIVRSNNNLEGWIKFFLSGLIESAQNAKETLKKIVILRKEYEEKIMTLGKKAKTAQRLLLHYFSNPIMSIAEASEHLQIGYPAASRLIKDLQKLGFLTELTGFSRNRLYELSDYLSLFKSPHPPTKKEPQ